MPEWQNRAGGDEIERKAYMKYKVLVTGRNNSVIDDFFIHMDSAFEVVSTSTRFGDIIRHLKFFNPDIFVYCPWNESQDSLRQMNNIKHMLAPARVPFILIGAVEDCDEFEKSAVNVANLILVKPFTASSIQEKIVEFMEEQEEYAEAYRERNGIVDIEKTEDENEENNGTDNENADSTEAKQEKGKETDAASKDNKENEGRTASDDKKEARKHILVVDDDPVMLKMLKEQLHDEYDVATAISGKIAMKFLDRKTTDLILLDYEMPDENGPKVMEKIRANEATKDVPIVFLTGVSEREKITEALMLKPQSYLLKPIDREKLLKVITEIIG